MPVLDNPARWVSSVAATMLIALGFASSANSADATVRKHAQGYAALDKLPDWSGLWAIPEDLFVQALIADLQPGSPVAPRLTPDYAAKLQAGNVRRMTGKDPPGERVRSNSEDCLPPGMPDLMRYPAGLEFLFTPGRVTMLSEENPTIRIVHTDGRGH